MNSLLSQKRINKIVELTKYGIVLIFIAMIFACSKNVMVSNSELTRLNYLEVSKFKDEGISTLPQPDIYPKYPNGLEGLLDDINRNIKYPQYSIDWEVEGEVVVEYIVEIDGKVKDISISKGVSAELDHEAKRVIKKLEKWYPGFKDGKPVRVLFRQPIKFKLD